MHLLHKEAIHRKTAVKILQRNVFVRDKTRSIAATLTPWPPHLLSNGPLEYQLWTESLFIKLYAIHV